MAVSGEYMEILTLRSDIAIDTSADSHKFTTFEDLETGAHVS